MRLSNFAIKHAARWLVLAGAMLLGLAQATEIPVAHAAKGLLWEIKSATNTVYLFGSIHLAKADFYPLPKVVEAAYRQAKVLAVEADVTDAVASKNALPLMSYVAPDSLQQHLSPATWKSLQSVAGPATGQFQHFKPAAVAIGLTVGAFAQQGYDPAYGIDLHFIERAKTDQKKLFELESLAFQAGVLGGLSDAEGDALLKQTLDAFTQGEALRETGAMIAAWKSGDAAALAKIFQESANKDAGSQKLMKLLLDDRNVGMTQKISQLLADGSKAFVVVGAGHLVGANSIIDVLQKQGVPVRRIK
ncbi:MAG: TraB/GumN family protein [Undibacterium sp.]|uniref:TraB/GumN family protein n=1 Tax=Undibacterium sp. TaxID=1914977 RepID=UPI00271BF958|nr:TraB/GumN family protein [Undibacterium sp.]MDO8651035.1 TraB/GumN family protein [Undibacterium sp.]